MNVLLVERIKSKSSAMDAKARKSSGFLGFLGVLAVEL
jgi:hypothetical protein